MPATYIPPLSASSLFALSQGTKNTGTMFQCHWCGSPCEIGIPHDDVASVPFIRSKSTARCPSQPYVCAGCNLWKRPKNTIYFLGGKLDKREGFKDGQAYENHSWWITEQECKALEKVDYPFLWDKLLKPPKRFLLCFKLPDQKNLLQLLVANDPGGIVKDTPLYFTQGSTKFTFTIYELEEAIRNGPAPYGPGVHALFKILGEVPTEVQKRFPKPPDRKGTEGGRPPAEPEAREVLKKLVTSSGEVKKHRPLPELSPNGSI